MSGLLLLLLVIIVSTAAVVTIIRRRRTHGEPIVANPADKPAASTFLAPTIQLIHASDAQHHIAELKSILLRMKAENRISGFTAYDISTGPDFKIEDCQGILVMLTNDLGQLRNDIESSLKDIIQKNSNIKLIEIIVDNLPYHNDFISLPHDLLPIRSRENMNLVWAGIERDLQALFPKPEPDLPPPPIVRNDRRTQLLRGIVKGYQQRFEIERYHNKAKVVWTFRIECYENDELVNTIPVQMVGDRFEGDINDGDDVEVFRWRKGTVLKTNRVKNWTTGIEVRSSSGSAVQVFGLIIFLAGLAFIAFLVVSRIINS